MGLRRTGKLQEDAFKKSQRSESSSGTIILNQKWDTGLRRPVEAKKMRRIPKLPCPPKAAVLILLAVVLLFHFYCGPAAIAARSVKASAFNDWSKMARNCAYDLYTYKLDGQSEEDYFEEASRKYHEDISGWRELSACSRNEQDSLMTLVYGKYTVNASASRTTALSLPRLEEACSGLLDSLEAKTDFDRDSISKAKKVTVNLEIKGEEDSDRYTETVYMVKIGLVWKYLKMTGAI